MAKKPEGLPAYGFEGLLGLCDLATVTMLRRDRRQPADDQKPVACYWTGHDYALLWKASEARAMPALSPGRQARWDEARRCAGPGCGKTFKSPVARGRDGKRYCEPCQEPAAERLWHTEQAARTVASAEWAREIMADERTVLVHEETDWWSYAVHAEDLAGAVLVDLRVRGRDGSGRDPTPEQLACSIALPDVGDRLAVLADRRIVSWWERTSGNLAATLRSMDMDPGVRMRPANGDSFGKRYANWVGRRATHSSSFRFNYGVQEQYPTGAPVDVLERMRGALDEMAAGPVVSDG